MAQMPPFLFVRIVDCKMRAPLDARLPAAHVAMMRSSFFFSAIVDILLPFSLLLHNPSVLKSIPLVQLLPHYACTACLVHRL